MITLIAVMIAVYSVNGVWRSVTEASWATIPASVFGLVTAVGLVRGRRWAEPLAHAFLWMAAGVWIVVVAAGAVTRRPAPLELVPGVLFLIICAGSSVVVFRHYHPRG